MDINKLLTENEVELLQGGTVGDVKLIKCTDKNYVLKTQRKWERHGDPDCWRREYDMYMNEFDKTIPYIKIPQCYHGSMDNDTTYILMEYIDGTTGLNLSIDKLCESIHKINMFQCEYRDYIPWSRSFPAVESSFDLWYGKMKSTLSQPMKNFPDDLRCLLNDYAERGDDILQSFKKLPRTLCHGDVHHDNLILCGDDIYLIDWDSAGYGYMGEDAVDILCEAFVYSERDVSLMSEYRDKIYNSYGNIDATTARDIFMLAWGYRIAANFMYHDDYTDKQRCIDILRVMSVY